MGYKQVEDLMWQAYKLKWPKLAKAINNEDKETRTSIFIRIASYIEMLEHHKYSIHRAELKDFLLFHTRALENDREGSEEYPLDKLQDGMA